MNPNPLLLTVRALISVIDASDATTRGRSLRISRYAMRLAREMDVPVAEWDAIELGALLHDLGRNAVLNDVVLLPRALDPVERELMRTHANIGWELIKDIPGLDAAAEIVLTHHERPDGKGYPRGLAGDQVPIGARLVMVCAAFDAMTADRPYRRGMAPHAACAELRRHAGTQFYPAVVEAFVSLYEKGALWQDFTSEEMDLYVRKDLAA